MAAGALHTVALTDEEVYSWGDNSAGQLGNRTFRGASLPSEVVDLAGRGVCQVACGARHTLFVCHDGEVYGCGSSQHGQLPAGSGADPDTCRPAPDGSGLLIATPTRLRLRFLESGTGASAPVVSQVVAGAHSSAFLTRASDELPDMPPPRLWERLQAAVAAAHAAPNNLESDAHVRPIAAAVERIFSSAAAISAAFGLKDCVGMDVGLLESMQRSILELEPPAAPKKDDPQPTQDSLFQVGGRWGWRVGVVRQRLVAGRGAGAAAVAGWAEGKGQLKQGKRRPAAALCGACLLPCRRLPCMANRPAVSCCRPSVRPWRCW